MAQDREIPGAAALQMHGASPPAEVPWLPMGGLIATVSLGALAAGVLAPLLSFILERQATPPGLIGLSAAMTPLGFIVASAFTPALTRRVGAARLAVVCSILTALTLVLIAWTQDVWAWMPLRFLFGFFAKPPYVIAETSLIALAPPARRGRIMGLYSSVVSGGFALGPLSLGLVGTHGWPPFAIGIAAYLLCGLILLAIVPRLPAAVHEDEATSVAGFFALAPLLLFAVFIAAAFEQTLISMFPVYGAALGSSEMRIASLIACFIAGDAALQIVLGHMADRLGSSRTMLFCVVASVAGSLVLPFVFETWLIWPLLFAWGGVSFGIYTMALVQLGERFTGQTLIVGTAAFSLVWGTGGIVGSPVTGLTMQLVGHQGLPLSLGLICVVLGVFLTMRKRRA